RADHRAVVDHAARGRAAEVLDGFAQERATLESAPARITLHVQHARKAQDQARALETQHLARDRHPVRRRVVLHLLARLEAVTPSWLSRLCADVESTAEGGQRRVADRNPRSRELLGHPHEVSLASDVELTHALEMLAELVRAFEPRDIR